MTGYIQWPTSQEFKPQDVVLNGGLFWRMDDAGDWRIIDESDLLPICDGCGWRQQPFAFKAHQRECKRGAADGKTN